MKIGIIGCGYVGQQIARLWQENGHQVSVTTTSPDKVELLSNIAPNVTVLSGTDLKAIADFVQDLEVVLLSIGAKSRDLEIYRQTYWQTAKNVVTAISNSPVKQLIYTGSYAVLGNQQGEWVDETIPVNPVNERGSILCDTEEVLLAANSERLKVCILRLAGIYGAGRELIKIFRSWSGTTRPGKGDDYSNWIHVDDIVNCLEFARANQLTGIYHLTSDETLTTGEFFERLFATHNLPTITWDATQASVRPYNSRLSNQKLKDLGWQLVHPQIIF